MPRRKKPPHGQEVQGVTSSKYIQHFPRFGRCSRSWKPGEKYRLCTAEYRKWAQPPAAACKRNRRRRPRLSAFRRATRLSGVCFRSPEGQKASRDPQVPRSLTWENLHNRPSRFYPPTDLGWLVRLAGLAGFRSTSCSVPVAPNCALAAVHMFSAEEQRRKAILNAYAAQNSPMHDSELTPPKKASPSGCELGKCHSLSTIVVRRL